MQKVDFSEYRTNCKKYEKQLQMDSQQILRKCATAYAKKASLYCPPNMGKKNIQKVFYTRPILYVPDEVRKHKRQQDIENLRKGKLFKVEIKKNGRFIKAIYGKTIRSIKKYSKIRNRGLFKAMFGAGLQSIKEKIPPAIRSLLNKSKNLLNLKHLNKITQTSKVQFSQIKIDNNSYNNESFKSIAVRQGDKSAFKTMKRLLTKKAKEKHEL